MGTAASAAVMIPAMGFFARHLDTESFGLFTLVMAFVGYASVLDGGFARAVVREIAQAGNQMNRAERALGAAVVLVLGIGFIFGLLLWLLSAPLVNVIHVGDSLQLEAIEGFHWTALMIAPILLSMVWMSPLEAKAQFASLNILRSFGYATVFGCAVIAVYWMPTFSAATSGLLIGRMGMALISFIACRQIMGKYLYPFCLDSAKRLFQFGRWLTVSSIISPLMDSLDRFVLSAFSGASTVAFYAAPSEAISKMLALPYSVSRALFPVLSKIEGGDKEKTRKIATVLQLCIGLFLVMLVMLFGDQMMGLWLGEKYATASGMLIKILIWGVLFNAMATIPYTELQAMGHSKITAQVHLIEVIPFISFLLVMTYEFGAKGTAIAWVTRTLIDWILQSYFCRKIKRQIH